MLCQNRWSWLRGSLTRSCAQSRQWARRMFSARTAPRSPSLRERSLLLGTTAHSSLASMLRSRPKRGSSLSWSSSLVETSSTTLLRYKSYLLVRHGLFRFFFLSEQKIWRETSSLPYNRACSCAWVPSWEGVCLFLQFLQLIFSGLPPSWHQTRKCDADHGRSHQAYRLWHVQKGLSWITSCVWPSS